MELISKVIDVFLHLDKYLGTMITNYGAWSYGLLFLIIFFETGLVVTPFLPGDSILFAAGAFAALGYLDIYIIIGILIIAAILGDTVNYHIGKYFGAKAFSNEKSRIFKKEYFDKTQSFYDKHGGKTIILARFIPIIRTFAPFVAGIGNMGYMKFISYNAVGGVVWVTLFTLMGYFFGNLPSVKENFSIVIFAIIFISILPGIVQYFKHKVELKKN